jgi:long-chain acyl-CoA synthetase
MEQKHWFGNYQDIPHHIHLPVDACVRDLLDSSMRRYADTGAIHCAGQTLLYRDVDRQARDFAAYLQNQLHVQPGDRVAVMLPNVLAFPVVLLGLMRCGAIHVGINPACGVETLKHILEDSGAHIVVAYNTASASVAALRGQVTLRHVITVGLGDCSDCALVCPPIDRGLKEHSTTLPHVLSQGAALALQAVHLQTTDIVFLQYTRGTTGKPKGVALSHRNVIANTEQFKAMAAQATRPGKEVLVTAIAAHHIYALMVNFITYLSLGAAHWLVPSPRNFDAFIATLKTARPTVFLGTPSLYAGLVTHPGCKEVDWSRLRLAAAADAGICSTVYEQWKNITASCIQLGYGLAEASPLLCFTPSFADTLSSACGLPAPSTDIQLLDAQDREVPLGMEGEICAKGPQVMQAYWQQPAATAAAFTADGYLRTGDIGVWNAQGFLQVTARKQGAIVVQGWYVDPVQIETLVNTHPGVLASRCVARHNEDHTVEVHLLVAKEALSPLSENEILEWCEKSLHPQKMPKTVRFFSPPTPVQTHAEPIKAAAVTQAIASVCA